MSAHTPTKLPHRGLIRRRRRRLRLHGVALLLIGAMFGAWAYFQEENRQWASTDDAFVTGHLISLEALSDGTVAEVLAENTQSVSQGQVLVRLDGRHAEIEWRQAEADLAAAVRRIASLGARRETLAKRIMARSAALETVRHDLLRYRKAALDGAVSEQQVQNDEDRQRELEAALAEARAESGELDAQLRGTTVASHPVVLTGIQRLRRAYLDYQRREIRAPASGCVARRKVQVGDHLKPGAPLLAIIPLDQVWVEAHLLETHIAGVKPGQTAEIRVDAYPERVYHGRVMGLSPGTGSQFALLPTDNATGNFIHIAERLTVRIALDPAELVAQPLQPGLSTRTRIRRAGGVAETLNSQVVTRGPAYRTSAYDHELDGLDSAIARIIADNGG